MNIHSHDSMTPVSPKSPPLDAFRGNGAAVGPALLDTAASVSAKLDSSSSSAGLSVASLVLALKAKLAHGHVHDHFAAARNNLFDADPLSAANNAAAAEYISTLDCMELASLLMPLLKRDVLVSDRRWMQATMSRLRSIVARAAKLTIHYLQVSNILIILYEKITRMRFYSHSL